MDCKDNHNLVEAPKASSQRKSTEGTRDGRSRGNVRRQTREVGQEINHVIIQKVKQTNVKVEKVKVKTKLMKNL